MLWVLFSLVSFFALDAATQHQNMFVFGFLWPLSFSLVASVFRLCADATSICGIEFQFLWRSKRIIQFHQIDINCCGRFSFISVQAVKILLHTRQITKLLYDFITNGSGYKCSHIKISRDKNVHLCARVPIVNKRAKMKWNKFLYGAVCLGNDNNNNSSGIVQKSGKKIQQLVVVIKNKQKESKVQHTNFMADLSIFTTTHTVTSINTRIFRPQRFVRWKHFAASKTRYQLPLTANSWLIIECVWEHKNCKQKQSHWLGRARNQSTCHGMNNFDNNADAKAKRSKEQLKCVVKFKTKCSNSFLFFAWLCSLIVLT